MFDEFSILSNPRALRRFQMAKDAAAKGDSSLAERYLRQAAAIEKGITTNKKPVAGADPFSKSFVKKRSVENRQVNRPERTVTPEPTVHTVEMESGGTSNLFDARPMRYTLDPPPNGGGGGPTDPGEWFSLTLCDSTVIEVWKKI
jgi:hypothetical protein